MPWRAPDGSFLLVLFLLLLLLVVVLLLPQVGYLTSILTAMSQVFGCPLAEIIWINGFGALLAVMLSQVRRYLQKLQFGLPGLCCRNGNAREAMQGGCIAQESHKALTVTTVAATAPRLLHHAIV
jgi:hypothetical protein